MLYMLAQLCVAWPKRCDKYVSLACWIKRTLPDPMLPNKTPFDGMFDRKPHISLNTLGPQYITRTELEDWTTSWRTQDKASKEYFLNWKNAFRVRPSPEKGKQQNPKGVDRDYNSSNGKNGRI